MESAGLFSSNMPRSSNNANYWQRPLGFFYSEPSNRLLCYFLMAAAYIICTFASIMVLYGPLWLSSHLAFASAYAIHAALLYGGCYAVVDFFADRLGPETYKYQRRTVASQWMAMLAGFLLAYSLHRSTYYSIIGLYAPWVVEHFQANPELRRGLALELLYFSAWWAAKTYLIIQFSLYHQKARTFTPKPKRLSEEAKAGSNNAPQAPPFVCQAGGEHIRIGRAEITHVSVEDHYCRIHHINGQGVSHNFLRLTLKQLKTELHGDGFFQIHRSHLANLRHARGWKAKNHKRILVMDQGIELPISRSRMAELSPVMQRLNIPRLN